MSALAALALCAWLFLILARGRFWRCDIRLPPAPRAAGATPHVVAVVPARNEAASIGRSVAGILAQRYAGRLSLVVVDDASDDGTAGLARAAAASVGANERLVVVETGGPPPGWAGKVWAMARGLEAARNMAPDAVYVWFSDADVVHGPDVLHRLVDEAEGGRRDLVSLMVRLDSSGRWGRLLIPAFVFFFQKLYPFRHVRDPSRGTAAAAGGCMLVRAAALARAGGLEAIKGALIDDCALARLLKRRGAALWLGHADASRSLRPSRRLGDVWAMVTRSAFHQLRYSPALLALTVLGMALLYLVPPVALAGGLAAGHWTAAAAGGGGWALMAAAYRPTLALYGRPAGAALLLPVAALLYVAMTLDSARRHWQGKGGMWKARSFAPGRPG